MESDEGVALSDACVGMYGYEDAFDGAEDGEGLGKMSAGKGEVDMVDMNCKGVGLEPLER